MTERRCIYFSIELTFAGIHTFKPPVISVSVAGISTVPKPSTARSTTTSSARFLKRGALRTCNRTEDQRLADWRGERLSGDELSVRYWPTWYIWKSGG